jgi:hypothetical protein
MAQAEFKTGAAEITICARTLEVPLSAERGKDSKFGADILRWEKSFASHSMKRIGCRVHTT